MPEGKLQSGVAPIKPDTLRPNRLGCTAVVIISERPHKGANRYNARATDPIER